MTDPEYTISIQPGYVLVEDPSNYDLVWSEQPSKLKAIAAVCSEAGTNKVLIQGSKANVKLSVMEIYVLGEEIAKLHLKVAIFTSTDLSKKDKGFFQNVAINRGSYIQFFDNEQDAIDWLDV